VDVLLLKLAIAPTAVLLASLVARRLGPTLGGRLIGLPLTTGPFLLLLALGPGDRAAAKAAVGTVAGEIAVVAFCVGYAYLSRSLRWPHAVAGSLVLAAVGAVTLGGAGLPAWLSAVTVLTAIVIGLLTWPATPTAGLPIRAPGRWETPVRMATTGAVVASLGAASVVLGPYVAGVLATWPVILSVMAPTTQRCAGPAAAGHLVHGSVASMAGTVAFVATLSYALVPFGTLRAFLLAATMLLLIDRGVTVGGPAARQLDWHWMSKATPLRRLSIEG
jgi:hypothetical protein